MSSDAQPGVKMFGLEYDRQRNRTYPFYEQELVYDDNVAAGEMKTGSENLTEADQTPGQRTAAKLRKYDPAAFLALVQALPAVGVPGQTQVRQLPPVLASITGTYFQAAGAGSSDHLASDMAVDIVNAGSGSLNPRSSAEASANIVGMLTYDLVNWYADAVVRCTFWEFTDVPNLSNAAILAKLSALTGLQVLPIFKKKAHQIVILSTEVAIQQSADTDASISVNLAAGDSSFSENKGTASSSKVGLQPRVETIPESIHGALTLPNSASQAVSVTVTASIPNIPATGSPIIAAITNTPATLTATASASFTPTTLAATTPAAIPVTGLYITDISAQQGEMGTVDYRITVVDFAQYA